MRVLLVDFDSSEVAELTNQLESQNLKVRHVATAEEASAVMKEQAVRAVIVGDSLVAGTEAFVQRIRAAGHGTPVVVLTNKDDPDTKITLLDGGADDVITRPYHPGVLMAQIRSLVRRCAPNEGAVLKFEDLQLDLRSLQVTRQGQTIPSTSRELAVLEYLMRNRQRVITRTELAEAIWNDTTLPGSNVIEVFIARLRRKVDRPFDVPLIHTIVGRGYMLSVTKPGRGNADTQPELAESDEELDAELEK